MTASWPNPGITKTQDFAQQPYHLASVGSRLPDGCAQAWSIVASIAVLEAGAPSTLEPEGAMSERASPTNGKSHGRKISRDLPSVGDTLSDIAPCGSSVLGAPASSTAIEATIDHARSRREGGMTASSPPPGAAGVSLAQPYLPDKGRECDVSLQED